jgi:predicted transcriptional regulator of viral defense system
MKHKNTSTQSNELLSYLHNKNKTCFTHKEALKIFPTAKENTVSKLLSDMTKRGLIMRIKEGIYYIIPFEEEANSFMPDWHLIVKYLVRDAKHYIGYYSALQIHNLITQPSLKEQIVVSKQMRPSEIKIKNITFQFIYHNENHFFGEKKIWIDDFNKVQSSDIEKTIIDCLFKPDYAGGIVEVARAIYSTKEKLDFNKLFVITAGISSEDIISFELFIKNQQ